MEFDEITGEGENNRGKRKKREGEEGKGEKDSLCPTLHIKMPGPLFGIQSRAPWMPVSISSPRFSLKESKNPSVCLKMLIPLNGSEIAGEQGGGAVVAEG
ncbi:hypothetical protein JOQ06_029755 [Pogonophryne albipinna]|uniref:Uncharacterized protein n=1 Tax=Pogonophryne albipinna TaxID=1090488 RepID=A0AAD6AY74_9TELE|nr:hypothetical protein JOQ06_029755 [Pogonophryne albipinna]